MSKTLLLALATVCSLPGYAQPIPLIRTELAPVFGNLYAQQQVNLLPGFESFSNGFEARTKREPAVAGSWSAPSLWTSYERYGGGTRTGMVGIHTHVLPNGNVLSWEGHNDNEHILDPNPLPGTRPPVLSHAYEWSPNPSATLGGARYPNGYLHFDTYDSNIFCAGHSFLADGRLLVAGGHYSGGKVLRNSAIDNTFNPEYIPIYTYPAGSVISFTNGAIGLRDANAFNYLNNPLYGGNFGWQTPPPPMKYRRWYPTNTSLANGDVLVTAGQRYGGPAGTNAPGIQANNPEVYQAATNTWRELTGATRQLPLYPWMFVAPDGRVFNAGPNIRTGFLNTTGTGLWADGPLHLRGRAVAQAQPGAYDLFARGAGTAVMYAPGKILITGGYSATDITNSAETIDLNSPVPAWAPAGATQYPRCYADATVLPDGTVLLTGGTLAPSTAEGGAVLAAELWTPPAPGGAGSGTWTTLNEMHTPRLYHAGAVLLPDATVLVLGGGQGGGFQDHPDYEIFTPPYLLRGLARPQITSAPAAVAYGQAFAVGTPDAAAVRQGGRAALVRLSSVTHSFNMNQRYLPLAVAARTATSLTLTAPANPNDCPPGHYLLFLLDANGTPSLASVVAVNTAANTCLATPLSITQSAGATNNACDRTTRFTATGGTAPYNWTVNGLAFSGGATIEQPTDTNSPTLQVTVQSPNSTCGATSSLTSYFPQCPMPCNGCGIPRPAAPASQPQATR